jgi:hypothetical protein
VASPTFGLLRDWARINAPMNGKNVAAKLTEHDAGAPGADIEMLANSLPVKLRGNPAAGLQPILVEATMYVTFSLYPMPDKKHQIRQHIHPRVVLWNPYNLELNFDRSVIFIQGNGIQNLATDAGGLNASANLNVFGGGFYFSIPATRFAPGDCLVFSPVDRAEYSVWRDSGPAGSGDVMSNELSCEVAPDIARNYYISGLFFPPDGWSANPPATTYWFEPPPVGDQRTLQAQDSRAILKHVGGSARVDSREAFAKLPQIAVLSGSLQYGGGQEPRIYWSRRERMPWEILDRYQPVPTEIPNVRTREAIRMRWFQEHNSNLVNSGSLNNTPHFEDALLANWNPRASFAMRSPWENIAGSGAPWFWGAYTRDLYDGEVDWQSQQPVVSGGRARGNPFGTPQEGAARYILFDVPRLETGVLSLAQYQHVRLSEFVWHPSYVVGNSLADPRLANVSSRNRFGGLSRSAAMSGDSTSANYGGFGARQIGSSTDQNRNEAGMSWADLGMAIIGNAPRTDNVVYDLSFEANRALWDSFFLSTGSQEEKKAFAKDPAKSPLPNGRMRLVADGDADSLEDDLGDFHQAASRLMIDGAFNVNSTRKEAWKALLASTRNVDYKDSRNIPFPRVLDAPGRAWKTGDSTDMDNLWDCHRELTPEEIDQLAEAIVAEVRLRGPFLSLADFVNRRLREGETGLAGPLETAIHKAGINATLAKRYRLDNSRSLPNYTHPDRIQDPTMLEQTFKPESKVWGCPAWLTQADVLQVIGPALSARSDTFVVRAYGDSVVDGKVMARAWCEAVLQRLPEPVNPDASGINPSDAGTDKDLGRRFTIRSFRWLTQEELARTDRT